MYALEQHPFRSPKGRSVTMWIRADTNDWNTCYSALNEDEYGLRDLDLTGTALDVGAHIGAVSVALLIDNPGLALTCLEAVPPNVELLQRNLEANGLSATVVEGMACARKTGTARIAYGYRGNELARHHAFVGNSTILEQAKDHDVAEVPCHSLAEFTPLDFLKIDCEGCEWDFLRGVALRKVARIHGEAHSIPGHTKPLPELTKILAGFTLTVLGPKAGPFGFVAVRDGK